MTTKWATIPLWSVAREQREVVEPAQLGEKVVHYSIPSVDATGTGQVEDAGEIKSAKLRLRGGEVLISKLNPRISRVVQVNQNDLPLVASTEFVALHAQRSLDSRFLAYFLQSEMVRQQLDARVQSVTRSHQRVAPEDITHLMINLPELGEQLRIADFLDAETARIDRMQLATQRQASLLVELLKERIRTATTVGRGPSVRTGIAWMPEMNASWRLVKVSHTFRTGGGTTPTSDRPEYFDGPYPWVNSADINNGDIFSTGKSVTAQALRDFPTLRIHPAGSLVIALYGQGATKGNVGILRIPACLNQACCALIPTGSITSNYALYWFRAHKDGIVALAHGAGQPNLSQELVRNLKIPVPELPEQHRITNELRRAEEDVQRRLNLLRTRQRLLAERRQALITAAVTGQIDVSTASGRTMEG